MISEILIFVIIVIIAKHFFGKQRPKNFPPGPRPLPVIGNLHQLGKIPHITYVKLAETYGSVFGISFAGYPAVILNDLTSIKEAFSTDAFTGRPKLRPILERGGKIRRGIILTDGEIWNDQRRFLIKTLRDLGFGKKSMEEKIQFEIKELAETFHNNIGKPISLTQTFNGPVLNSLWNIMTGDRFEKDDPVFKKAIYYIIEGFSELKYGGLFFFFPTLSKIFPNWTGYNQFMRTLSSAIGIINETVKHHKDTFQDGEPRDLIDVFLQKINKTKNQQSSFFRAEGENNLTMSLADMFIAGAETTSTALRWAFFILALKTDEQEILYNEIKNVVGLSKLPSLNDKENMPCTEAFIMELLRFSGIIPLGVFHRAIRDTNFQGYWIPEDTIICSNLFAVLHDPKVWGDPDVFRPNRFISPDGKLNRNHEAFMPFSTGKRVCLGETLARDELFLFVTTLFQKFQITFDLTEPIPALNDYISALLIYPVLHRIVFYER